MRIKTIIIGILIGAAVGAALEFVNALLTFLAPPLLVLLPAAVLIGGSIGFLVHMYSQWRPPGKTQDSQRLPVSVAEFVKLVIEEMRYRKKVRADVMAELTAHFEDGLKDCKSDDEKDKRAKQLISEFGDAKLLGALLRRAKKRCRPLWRTIASRTFQTVGVLILCLIGYCFYISFGRPTIGVNYLEEITHLARTVVDENQNAAVPYQKAIDAYQEPPQIEQEVQFDPYMGSRSKFIPKRQGQKWVQTVSLLDAISDEDRLGDLNQDERSALEKWIPSNAKAAELLTRASEKPHCWWRFQAEDDVVLAIRYPQLRHIRQLVRLLCWRARLKAHNGNVEGALEDLLTCYRVGRHFKGPRTLIEQLVGMAIQRLTARNAFITLGNQQIETRLLKDFQDQLNDLMDQDSFAVDYQTERFFALDFLQRCYTDDGKGSGRMIPGRIRAYWRHVDEDEAGSGVIDHSRFLALALVSTDREQMRLVFEELYTNAEQLADKTPWQARGQTDYPEAEFQDWSYLKRVRYLPFRVFAPSYTRVNTLAYHGKAELEAVITTLAALRHKQEKGAWPDNLEQLLQLGYLKELPSDPYSDKPLIYKKTDDAFTLYSVGENFADDGGTRYGDSWKWGDHDKGDRVFWPIETYQQEQERLEKEAEKRYPRRLDLGKRTGR